MVQSIYNASFISLCKVLLKGTNRSRKAVYLDATDPYDLLTEAELFKILNKILGTNTIWDFALQRSWFNQDHKDEEYKVYCPCGRSHEKS